MTAKPTDQKTDIPSFEVLLNGEVLSQEYQVLSISVLNEINKIPKAYVSISDGDVAQNDFPLSSSDLVIPGTEIEIKAGYHSKNETIFKGIITSQRVRVKKSNASITQIEARSKLYKMTFNKKFRLFEDMTDSDIAEEIFGGYDFKSDVESTSLSHESMVQYNATDWDFLLSRIEANGHLFYPNNEGLKSGAPSLSSSPVMLLEYGSSVLEFDLEIDSRKSDTGNKALSWDPAEQSTVEAEGEEPGSLEFGNLKRSNLDFIEDAGLMVNQGKTVEAELQAWTNAKLLRSELSRICGVISGPGYAAVNCGDLVEINGINERFNGNAFVGGVSHEIAGGTWLTDIQVGLNDEFLLEDKHCPEKTNPLLPGINNLFCGTAMALEGDPQGEDRIQIHIPALHEEGTGIWARLSTLDAGENRGSVFRPEIDDEVIVGFINGDPRAGVVLGMLHSSAKPAPIPGSDDNHEKGFISRSEMKIVFNDDSNILSLETPNGNKLTLSEEDGSVSLIDENGNSLIMNADGITIESAKDIIMKASGDISMEGINISAAGSAEFKAEGSAAATLESSGSTTVKGSIVQIN